METEPGAVDGDGRAGDGSTGAAPVLRIPDLCLVVMVAAAGCGKSTFTRRHLRATEILSSDLFRAMLRDDEADQTATADAFEVLHLVARKRLRAGRLTVIDSTSVQASARKPLLDIARECHVPAVAIVLDLPEEVCQERNRARTERRVRPDAISLHLAQLRAGIGGLRSEGFRRVFVLDSVDAVEHARIEREPLPVDRRGDHGPFDVVGDVHGCGDELDALLDRLGHVAGTDGVRRHPDGRRVVFLGDLVDRGPRVAHVLKMAMAMVRAGTALAVPGNHDAKLVRALRRHHGVQVKHGLQQSLDDVAREPPEFASEVAAFLDALPTHYVLDGGALVVAHAGLKEEMHGRAGGEVRAFALYGDTTGEVDRFGLPVRRDWAREYHGRAAVVYGHTPVPEAVWVNGTINIDTGCVFGGKLTALRWPERELVSVPAAREYAESRRPFLPWHVDPSLPRPAGGTEIGMG
jgi:protein phosphatase